MADATVSQGRRDDPLPLAKEPASVAPRLRTFASRPLAILWAGIVAAIVIFLAFGTVRIGAGNWIGLRMPVRRIWTHFTRFLLDEGASTAMIAGVTAAAIASLLGAAVILWLAFAVRDDRGEPASDDAPGQ